MVKKTIQKTYTPEESRKLAEDSQLKNLLDHLHNIPEPTIFFKVGEEVCLGGLIEPAISEIFENGKYYKIHYKQMGAQNSYSDRDKVYEMDGCWPWTSIEKKVDQQKEFAQWDSEKYRLNFMQQSMSSLLNKIYSFGVDFEPDYQIGYVWSLEDKQELISSIFQGLDIGKFVFVVLPWRASTAPCYEILDGKQRLSAIKEFKESRFKFNGLYWHELSNKDRNFFTEIPISVAEIREGSSRENIINQFIRLNSFGKVMDKSHLDTVKNMLKGSENA